MTQKVNYNVNAIKACNAPEVISASQTHLSSWLCSEIIYHWSEASVNEFFLVLCTLYYSKIGRLVWKVSCMKCRVWRKKTIGLNFVLPNISTYYGFFSPPPVKPVGTIGLHSVCLSVRPSVRPSVRHTSFRTITDSVIHLWSWNFIHLLPMSQGCALLILGSKGQRSRSWRMVIWKWFPDDNRLCNQPMIMKLHTLTHHESRMCPIDFEVKRSKVKVMAHGYLKMVSGR